MDIINKLEIPEELITNEENICLFFIKPDVLENPPEIDPSLIKSRYLKIDTPETMYNHFLDLLEPEIEVRIINGIPLDKDSVVYSCNYCHKDIMDDWYYCHHCRGYMCSKCYKNDEFVLDSNKDNFDECKKNKMLELKSVKCITLSRYCFRCDLCFLLINRNDMFYSCNCGNNVYDTYDICLSCYEKSNDAKRMVDSKQMKLINQKDKQNHIFEYTGFGSMLYWFPIITDLSDLSVLINLNPNDVNFRKLCLKGVDNHGREGYYIVNNKEYDLSKIINRLNEICEKGFVETEEWCSTTGAYVMKNVEFCSGHYFISPIQMLMEELNMQTYYG